MKNMQKEMTIVAQHDGVTRIMAKMESMAVPMDVRVFTREQYNRLFPKGRVNTPIGVVKLGEKQFEKLEARGRQKLLGAVYQTLTDPIAILPEIRNGKESRLYIKSFKETPDDKRKNVMSIVVNIEGKTIVISTSERRDSQIEDKIKMASSPLYLKS